MANRDCYKGKDMEFMVNNQPPEIFAERKSTATAMARLKVEKTVVNFVSSAVFDRLQSEIVSYLEDSWGSGVDIPAWLARRCLPARCGISRPLHLIVQSKIHDA